MPLATQVAGMLLAGGLAVVLARQAGVRGRMSFAAVAVVPVVVACVLALPAVRDSSGA